MNDDIIIPFYPDMTHMAIVDVEAFERIKKVVLTPKKVCLSRYFGEEVNPNYHLG